MLRRFVFATVTTLVVAVGSGSTAAAEEIALRPRYEVGDSYTLSLSAAIDTEVRATSAKRRSHDDLQLRYEATVVVLETDGAGTPIRERHDAVALTYVRPGDPEEMGSLFQNGTQYEVRRTGGDVQIFFRGERVQRKVEQIVAHLLQSQFEYSLGALVDPGRAVEVGDSWQLDREQVRSFLRARGVEGVRLDEPATATLERQTSAAGEELAIRYRIPIAGFELSSMPENASGVRSNGALEGEVQLAAGGVRRPLLHSSTLALDMKGAVYAPGSARAVPWTYRRNDAVDQRTQLIVDQVAAAGL